MSSENIRQRVSWTTRIAVLPKVKDAFREMAEEEKVSVAHLIGNAMNEYISAKSS